MGSAGFSFRARRSGATASAYALLEVDRSEPGVDFGDAWLQLLQSFVHLGGVRIAPFRQSTLALLNQDLNASGVSLRATAVRGRRCPG